MKRLILLLTIGLIFNSCSTSENNTDEEVLPIPQQATIESYSKNYGYSGDIITIIGTNFNTDIEDVSVLFGDVPAIINSVTNQEISITLPLVENSIPVLNITINNRIISNNVINNYNKNIGILANSLNKWHRISSSISGGRKLLVTNNESAYISKGDNGGGGYVYRTIDGGLTWQNWAPVGFYLSYFPTTNDEGWSDFIGVNKVPVGGSQQLNFIFRENFSVVGMNVNEDLLNGTIITPRKVVYKTTNGVDFIEVYNGSNGKLELQGGYFSLSNNQIWQGGRSSTSNKLTLFYLTNTTNDWQEIELSIEGNNTNVNKIQFINNSLGFIKVYSPTTGRKLCKTVNAGNTWEVINENIDSFCFKNESIGWYTLENKIYKTIDGGANWSLDYTNSSNIHNISYGDGLVYAITEDSILKKFTE